MIPRTLALAALAAVLAACGGGAGSSASLPAQAPSISAVAHAHSLTGCQAIPPTLYASAETDCTDPEGRAIDLATFASSSLRDKWIAAASAFGPVLFKGPGYAATTG